MKKKKKRARRTNLSFLDNEHRSPLRYFIRSSLVEKWKKMTCPSFSSCFDRRRNTYWSFFLFFSSLPRGDRSSLSLSSADCLARQLVLIFARRNSHEQISLPVSSTHPPIDEKESREKSMPWHNNRATFPRSISHSIHCSDFSLLEEIFLRQRKEKIMSNRFSFARLFFLFLVLSCSRRFFRSPLGASWMLVCLDRCQICVFIGL